MKDEQVKKSIFSRKYRQSFYLICTLREKKEREITVMAVLVDAGLGDWR
jgi:hypothetical protein